VTVPCVSRKVRAHVSGELLGIVAVVVQVHLDFAVPAAHEASESVEILRSVLLARKKEGVARRTPVRVTERSHDPRVALHPVAHAPRALSRRNASPERLEMIADRDEQVNGAGRRPTAAE
jgi:hypothetical protein